MHYYLLKRVLQIIPALFLASILIFLIIYLTPGDPAILLLGSDAQPETLAALREHMGLNKPLYIQYLRWSSNAVRLDLGQSVLSDIAVTRLILLKLPATLELAIAASVLSVMIAFPMGLAAALRRGSRVDYLITSFNALALAVPTFWLGILLILLFTLRLGWLPPSGIGDPLSNPVEGLRHLIMPAITLAIPLSAVASRFLRAAMIEVMSLDFIRTARSKGLTERTIIYRHALPNALVPVVTILGIQFGQLLGGAVLVESIFDWPGLGKLLLFSIMAKDYAVIQGILLFVVTGFLLINLFIDVLYAFLDPRIRYS